MAEIYRCDVCGKEIDNRPMKLTIEKPRVDYYPFRLWWVHEEAFDFCDDCNKEVLSFIAGLKDGDES